MNDRLGEDPFISRRDMDEAEKSIERGELRDPFFQVRENEFIELKGDEAKDPVLLARRKREQELAAEAPRQDLRDHIAEWENAHKDYVLRNIDTDKVKINNYSERELSLEFVDFLIGNATEVLERNEALQNMSKINISHITKNNDGIVLSVTSEDGKILNLFFSGGNQFTLIHAQKAEKGSPV
jgi:hypothetical protein